MSSSNKTTVRQAIRSGAALLKESSDNFSHAGGYRDDAKELLEFVLGEEPELNEPVPAAKLKRFEKLMQRRAAGEPIPYIIGKTEFDGLELIVKKGAFVPRWTTEAMAAEAVKKLRSRKSPVHVDLATGIGPVALAVGNRVPKAKVFGVDVSARAVDLARANASALGLRNVTFFKGDLFAPLPKRLQGKVDSITIHPPYVAGHEVEDLPNELKNFEPVTTLTDRSPDGLWLLQRTAEEGLEWLRPGGWLIVEIGSYLARKAAATVAKHDFKSVETKPGPLKYNKLICARR